MKIRKLCFIPVKTEPWEIESYHATIRGIYIYNGKLAYYEVSRDKDTKMYYCSFWYGNQGRDISINGKYSTYEEACNFCQAHYEKWITENTIISNNQ